jgi:DNA mismatch endonuclease (patch repair protein)
MKNNKVGVKRDKLTPEQRSFCMSRIRAKNTSIEKSLGKALWSAGIRYRKHFEIDGTPDFAIPKYKIAIFCDSSFWHGYKNMKTKIHSFKTNEEFWRNKIESNIGRDEKVNAELERQGWAVLRFWDFQIKENLNSCVDKVKNILNLKKSIIAG